MPTIVTQNGQLKALPNNNLNRSSEVQEFISHKPNFIIRWGITIFFLVLLSLAAVCWFIQYPDLVISKAKLNSINAPKEIITHTDGKLIKVLVKENDTVHAGQVMAHMESLANPDAVLHLSKQVDAINKTIENNQTNEIVHFFSNGSNQTFSNQLGEVQTNYQTFIQAFITFKNYLSNGFYLHKRVILQTDLQNIQKQNIILNTQKELLIKDLSLTNETFKANETLAKEKVISSMDYRNEESKLIAKKMALPQINSSIVSNESQQNEKRKEIAELENQIIVQKSIFIQALQTFKSQLQAWEYKYLLKSSIDGTVSFTGFFQENQEIRSGQALFYIQPNNTNYFVEMLIPQYNFGKVKQGQEVLLKFQAYPYEQFGAVVGKIDYINKLPTDSGYLAKVVLPQGLTTNYKKELKFRNGLYAEADIVTENMRLLERFYYNLVKQISR
jgi:HlyD family secretion protein